jgi:hypothetical protein
VNNGPKTNLDEFLLQVADSKNPKKMMNEAVARLNARHAALITAVNADELKDRAFERKPQTAPNAVALFAEPEKVSNMVSDHILTATSKEQLIHRYEFYASLMDQCIESKNFLAAKAIAAGLVVGPVDRIMQHVGGKAYAKIRDITDDGLFSNKRQNGNIRDAQNKDNVPIIITSELIPGDLTRAYEGNTDVNNAKQIEQKVIADFLKSQNALQNVAYKADANASNLSSNVSLNDDVLHERSTDIYKNKKFDFKGKDSPEALRAKNENFILDKIQQQSMISLDKQLEVAKSKPLEKVMWEELESAINEKLIENNYLLKAAKQMAESSPNGERKQAAANAIQGLSDNINHLNNEKQIVKENKGIKLRAIEAAANLKQIGEFKPFIHDNLVKQILSGWMQKDEDGKKALDVNDYNKISFNILSTEKPLNIINTISTMINENKDPQQKADLLHNAKFLLKDLIKNGKDTPEFKELISFLATEPKPNINSVDPNSVTARFLDIVQPNANDPAGVSQQKQVLLDEVTQSAKAIVNTNEVNPEAILAKESKAQSNFDDYVLKNLATQKPLPAADKGFSNTAKLIAEDLKLHAMGLMLQIQPSEFHNMNWTKPKTEHLAPGLMAMTSDFNNLSTMIISDIMRANSPAHQQNIYNLYIKVMNESIKLGNYHHATAISGALNNAAVGRIKHLDKNAQKILGAEYKTFQQNSELLSTSKSFKLLREAQSNQAAPVPFWGVTSSDLSGAAENKETFSHEDKEIKSVVREVMMGAQIKEFVNLQNKAKAQLAGALPEFHSQVGSRINQVHLDEKSTYDQSLAVFPRGTQDNPTKEKDAFKGIPQGQPQNKFQDFVLSEATKKEQVAIDKLAALKALRGSSPAQPAANLHVAATELEKAKVALLAVINTPNVSAASAAKVAEYKQLVNVADVEIQAARQQANSAASPQPAPIQVGPRIPDPLPRPAGAPNATDDPNNKGKQHAPEPKGKEEDVEVKILPPQLKEKQRINDPRQEPGGRAEKPVAMEPQAPIAERVNKQFEAYVAAEAQMGGATVAENEFRKQQAAAILKDLNTINKLAEAANLGPEAKEAQLLKYMERAAKRGDYHFTIKASINGFVTELKEKAQAAAQPNQPAPTAPEVQQEASVDASPPTPVRRTIKVPADHVISQQPQGPAPFPPEVVNNAKPQLQALLEQAFRSKTPTAHTSNNGGLLKFGISTKNPNSIQAVQNILSKHEGMVLNITDKGNHKVFTISPGAIMKLEASELKALGNAIHDERQSIHAQHKKAPVPPPVPQRLSEAQQNTILEQVAAQTAAAKTTPPPVPTKLSDSTQNAVLKETATQLESEAKTLTGSKADEARRVAQDLRSKLPPPPPPPKIDVPPITVSPPVAANVEPPKAPPVRPSIDPAAQLAQMINNPMPDTISGPPLQTTAPKPQGMGEPTRRAANRQNAALANANGEVKANKSSSPDPLLNSFAEKKALWERRSTVLAEPIPTNETGAKPNKPTRK